MKKIYSKLTSKVQAFSEKAKRQVHAHVKKGAGAAESAIVERTSLDAKHLESLKRSVMQYWQDNQEQYRLKALMGQVSKLKAIDGSDAKFLVETPYEYWQGLLFYQVEDWVRTEELFRKAVEKNPNHARANFKLGMSLFKQKQWDAAYASILAASQLDPSVDKWKIQLIQSRRRMLTGLDFSGSSAY